MGGREKARRSNLVKTLLQKRNGFPIENPRSSRLICVNFSVVGHVGRRDFPAAVVDDLM